MTEIETEGLTLAYAAIDGAARTKDHKRLAELFIQLHAPRETVTMPTQDGLVVRHGVLKARKVTKHPTLEGNPAWEAFKHAPVDDAPPTPDELRSIADHKRAIQLPPPPVKRKKKPHV